MRGHKSAPYDHASGGFACASARAMLPRSMQGAVKPCPLSQGGITSAGTISSRSSRLLICSFLGGTRGGIWGNLGASGSLLATFARLKIIRIRRAWMRGEFSFGITSHKNYYVNSRVKNEETSAFEAN